MLFIELLLDAPWAVLNLRPEHVLVGSRTVSSRCFLRNAQMSHQTHALFQATRQDHKVPQVSEDLSLFRLAVEPIRQV